MTGRKTVAAIIPAAGSGERFGGKKQFAIINGEYVLKLALNALRKGYPFDEYIIGVSEEDEKFVNTLTLGADVRFSRGGSDRTATVINAAEAAASEFVAVHDAARPFVTPETVKNTVLRAMADGAAICGLFAVDTVKLVEDSKIISTVDRNRVFLAHTPQVFEREKLLRALNSAAADGRKLTDEASACELAGIPVSVTLSDIRNIKITYKEDLAAF
jgi:2-C-methyl-D-erythritol 4-phosphate cytidylyltransferase